ncbi:hypothetical protein PoB_006275200 [Plakobranchus ocellatus]|uniref:Uncharacterized protein n=1 Tax=Plakobranchus ocellatus TaxID=259542 RepID=A0AAV4CWG1_9GAST|nr:hypothetical protein PoB_006275200 [Plakobranchus ocellatus]
MKAMGEERQKDVEEEDVKGGGEEDKEAKPWNSRRKEGDGREKDDNRNTRDSRDGGDNGEKGDNRNWPTRDSRGKKDTGIAEMAGTKGIEEITGLPIITSLFKT